MSINHTLFNWGNGSPEAVVIGEGANAAALAQVLGSLVVPDSSLRTGVLFRDAPTSLPLLQCSFVCQVIAPKEVEGTTLWRHQMFWRMYGNSGGRDHRSNGLRWVIFCPGRALDAKNLFKRAFSASELFEAYRWVPLHDSLNEWVKKGRLPKSVDFYDWEGLQKSNKERCLREKMKNILLSEMAPETKREEVIKCWEKVSDLGWERFCPPPDSHGLANGIRAWLKSSEKGDVTIWIQIGIALFEKTTI